MLLRDEHDPVLGTSSAWRHHTQHPTALSSSALSLNLAYLSHNSLFDLFNGRAQLPGSLN